MDEAGLAAALRVGAVAGQFGAAFAVCPEPAASTAYLAALVHQPPLPTALTAVIPGRPARGLVNRFMALWRTLTSPAAPPVVAYSRAYCAGKALITVAQ